jgi:phosphatidylinositol glycan class M
VIGYLIHSILQQQKIAPQRAVLYTCMWLFHPFSLNMSSRGSAESLVGALSLAAIYFVLAKKQQPLLGGVMYGIAVHIKPYPVVFALSYWLYLGGDGKGANRLNGESGQVSQAHGEGVMAYPNVCAKVSRTGLRLIKKGWYLLWSADSSAGWVARWKFVLASVTTVALLTWGSYMCYGYEFLHESLLYHVVRKDTRHNFALYWYQQYLSDVPDYYIRDGV